MDAPICAFVENYIKKDPLRLHMPGHKGLGLLGCENRDLTEVTGADVLYHPEGIIRESERNAEALWGTARTVYSAEGSSLSIRAMVYLLRLHLGRAPRILAGRNAHKVFVSAAALLGAEITWLLPKNRREIVSCRVTKADVEAALRGGSFDAVYLTSPDYLGNMADIAGIFQVCHENGALLLVDNAHGAYLRFLPKSLHPVDLGADACCDSAHKTLPVLTGGGYLHISKSAPKDFGENADRAMALFASTSPSYLILQSLDAANPYLVSGFREDLEKAAALWEAARGKLETAGWEMAGDEPLKLTLRPKSMGYTGTGLAAILEEKGLSPEFSDPDYLVLMVSPRWGKAEAERVLDALLALPKLAPISDCLPAFGIPEQAVSPQAAIFAPCQEVPAAKSLGRIMAAPAVSCPPAIPIAACGERIDEAALAALAYYGIETVSVLK